MKRTCRFHAVSGLGCNIIIKSNAAINLDDKEAGRPFAPMRPQVHEYQFPAPFAPAQQHLYTLICGAPLVLMIRIMLNIRRFAKYHEQ